ncbi:hypothetical protein Aspvir_003296 [Aspergillus viridinutans]|uniref:NAD(P)-binding protein n=1 Tax=Aspergillus viridinutans TaxID=75553 RepID=A0A9P3FAW2_ASPVI|nr:uncharacterized protein Aspvir_003296 [Aspergillus viridinutans]GIK07630.1 hypothetical protein Aspvir_003296 [Aspergillus viridinutans]
MSTYLITGTSRGLGLALVRHLANLPSSSVGTIFATSRSEHPSLDELSQQSDRIQWVKCDVTDAASVQDAVRAVQGKLQGKGLDVLINNAGVMTNTKGGVADMHVVQLY